MYETAEPVADDTPSVPDGDIYSKGTFVRNIAPSEIGSASSKYIITGWTWKWNEMAGEPSFDRWVTEI